jgi:hypothetical protein
MQVVGLMAGLPSHGLVAIILLAIHHARGGLIVTEVLVRDLDASVVEKLKARALAARIRRRIGARPQTDSGMLQAEDRER